MPSGGQVQIRQRQGFDKFAKPGFARGQCLLHLFALCQLLFQTAVGFLQPQPMRSSTKASETDGSGAGVCSALRSVINQRGAATRTVRQEVGHGRHTERDGECRPFFNRLKL